MTELGRATVRIAKKKGDGDFGNVDFDLQDERVYQTLQERDEFYDQTIREFLARMKLIFTKATK